MCAEAMIRTNTKRIEKLFDRPLIVKSKKTEWDQRIKLTNYFPTIEPVGDELELHERVFPVIPFPNSRLSDLVENKKTGEEELVRIYERPTWASGFTAERCLAVMTSFFEPTYWGPEPGSVQEFSSESDEILLVAAIKIKPLKPSTGKRDGISLLTHVPNEFMLHYHHRLLVFLKPEDGVEWISGGKADPLEKFEELIEKRYIPKLTAKRDRMMAKGWEKRVTQHEITLSEEKTYIDFLKAEGIDG